MNLVERTIAREAGEAKTIAMMVTGRSQHTLPALVTMLTTCWQGTAVRHPKRSLLAAVESAGSISSITLSRHGLAP